MPKSLTIKEVPEELLSRLKAQAEKESKLYKYYRVQYHKFLIALLEEALERREKGETNEK